MSYRASHASQFAHMGTDVDTGRIWGLGGATLDMGGFRAFGMGGNIPAYNSFFIGYSDTKFTLAALCNTEEGDVIIPSAGALSPFIFGAIGDIYGLESSILFLVITATIATVLTLFLRDSKNIEEKATTVIH